MKKGICLLLSLWLLTSALAPALAEELPTPTPQPTVRTDNLITAPPDAVLPGAGMQIAPLEGGGDAVRILGVESEPVLRPVSAFQEKFIKFLKDNFDFEPTFNGPYYSDGGWIYVAFCGKPFVLARAVSDEKDAPLERVTIVGEKEDAADVLALTASAMYAAAQCGQMGQYAIQLMLMEQSPESYFEEDCDIWLENGYQMSTGTSRFDLQIGEVAYQGALTGRKTYAPYSDAEGVTPIAAPISVQTFKARMKTGCALFGLTPPQFSNTYQEAHGFRTYSAYWEDCPVLLTTDGEGKNVSYVVVASASGDTTSLWPRTLAAFFAASGAEESQIMDLVLVSGGVGAWDELSAMRPYAVLNDVMLQCTDDAELLIAFICGAEEK